MLSDYMFILQHPLQVKQGEMRSLIEKEGLPGAGQEMSSYLATCLPMPGSTLKEVIS